MDRPNCKYCGKPLRKEFQFLWPATSPNPIERSFMGYGFSGNNYFCSKSCGYYYAVDAAKMDEVRRKQREVV